MALVEVDPATFETIMDTGKLKIGWTLCHVYEYVNVKRCYKCYGFNHISVNCTKEETCSKCGKKGHADINCTATNIECVNCVEANIKYGLDLEITHRVFDRNCVVYKRQIDKLKIV